MNSTQADDGRGRLALAGLIVYVVLLGLGIFAEAFEVTAILDWPIY